MLRCAAVVDELLPSSSLSPDSREEDFEDPASPTFSDSCPRFGTDSDSVDDISHDEQCEYHADGDGDGDDDVDGDSDHNTAPGLSFLFASPPTGSHFSPLAEKVSRRGEAFQGTAFTHLCCNANCLFVTSGSVPACKCRRGQRCNPC